MPALARLDEEHDNPQAALRCSLDAGTADAIGLPLAAGDYDLVYLVLDFAPGAAIPLHFHGGPATVGGMDGVLPLRPEGAPEKTLRPGGVVNEKQGARHVMINTSGQCPYPGRGVAAERRGPDHPPPGPGSSAHASR